MEISDPTRSSTRSSARSSPELLQMKLTVPNGLPEHPSPHVRSQLWSPSSSSTASWSPSTSSPEPSKPSKPKTAKRPKPLKLDDSNKCTCGRPSLSPKRDRSSSIVQLSEKLKKIRTCFRHSPAGTPMAESKPVSSDKIKAQKAKKKKKKTRPEYDYEDIGECHWADDF